eukprot:6971106-Prymnesium_polylepis.1
MVAQRAAASGGAHRRPRQRHGTRSYYSCCTHTPSGQRTCFVSHFPFGVTTLALRAALYRR